MTEEESRTKWCPMIRQIPDTMDGGGFMNNRGEHPHLIYCIASDCMWWVWDKFDTYEENGVRKSEPVAGHCGAVK